MAVVAANGTVTPVVGTEVVVATIAGGPFDNVGVFVQGGNSPNGSGQLLYSLYAVVGTVQSLIAESRVIGSVLPTILSWQSPLGGPPQSVVAAGGTSYVLTVTALPGNGSRFSSLNATLAGVDDLDTAADSNISNTFIVTPGNEVSSANVGGFAQFMDVSADLSVIPRNNGSVTFIIYAKSGTLSNSVEVVVREVSLIGPDEIQAVLREIQLPPATIYRVGIRNDTGLTLNIAMSVATYSVQMVSGGPITLDGDVTGPSNTNTVIKWSNLPLNRTGANSFAAPVDGAIPIYNGMLGQWNAIPFSGDVQLFDTGQTLVVAWEDVPLDVATMSAPSVNDVPIFNVDGSWHAGSLGGAITLAGDVTGSLSATDVVAWRHQPIDATSFGAPPSGGIPIYDNSISLWRAFAPSGDITLTATGGVTVVGWENHPLDSTTMSSPGTGTTPVFNGTHWVAESIVQSISLTASATDVFHALRAGGYGVTLVNVTGCGGGGGGGGGQAGGALGGGTGAGGGGAALLGTIAIAINLAHQIDVVIGGGGIAGTAGVAPAGAGTNGGDGGTTTLVDADTSTVLISFSGGSGGQAGAAGPGAGGPAFPDVNAYQSGSGVAGGGGGGVVSGNGQNGNANATAIGIGTGGSNIWAPGSGGASAGAQGGGGGGGGAGAFNQGANGGASSATVGGNGSTAAANSGAGGGGGAGGTGVADNGGSGGVGGSGALSAFVIL